MQMQTIPILMVFVADIMQLPVGCLNTMLARCHTTRVQTANTLHTTSLLLSPPTVVSGYRPTLRLICKQELPGCLDKSNT